MALITLLTDFGLRDGAAGIMKGVILGIAPGTQIVDLSHTIGAHDILQGAIILRRALPFFGEGTVHVAVVDPGVGTDRRPIAGRFGPHYFVGPDNGLLTPLLERAERHDWPVEMVKLDRPDFWLPAVSDVFHGRDVFAPVAAHLANGIELSALGTAIDDPIRLPLPEPHQIENGWRGQVIQIDEFGNIATDIFREHLAEMNNVLVRMDGVTIPGLVRTFGERAPGSLIALYGTDNDLIISIVEGNAAARLNVTIGDTVEVIDRPVTEDEVDPGAALAESEGSAGEFGSD
jgi:S-adenosyl-L-methionine hydrolase (adenosine-forming)